MRCYANAGNVYRAGRSQKHALSSPRIYDIAAEHVQRLQKGTNNK